MFVTKNDIEVQIRAENLDQITTTPLQNQAIEVAIQLVSDHLYLRYDTSVIFAQVGNARHKSLVDACVTIVLYKLYKRVPSRKIPEWLAIEYGETMELLTKIADGRIGLELPRREADASPNPSKIRYSSSDFKRSL